MCAVDIDKSDFSYHWLKPGVKGVMQFIAAIQLLKMKWPKLPKKQWWTHISIEQ